MYRIFAALLGLLSATFMPAVVYAAEPFKIFDATAYRGKPDLSIIGITRLPIVNEGNADTTWGKTNRAGMPAELPVMRNIKEVAANYPIVCLDYEAWPLNTAEERSQSIPKLLKIIQWAREAAPGKKFGFYSLVPARAYWSAVAKPDSVQRQSWIDANTALKPLADAVDAVFPSLYTFYSDEKQWEKYAVEQITQARRYGKPVYVFLWPQYHESNRLLGLKYLPREYWRKQLEIAHQHADGLVIWGGWDFARNQPLGWDEEAQWWQETKSFVATKSAPPSAPQRPSAESQ